MTTTPNIGIYIAGNGEQDWGTSFDSGLLRIDQHDHSGPPYGGVPISGAGIADGSITGAKLNPSIFGTGVEAEGMVGGPIAVKGVLKSFYTVGGANTGIACVTVAGTTVAMRTLTGTANQIDISNGDGVAGNPTISINRDNQLAPATGDVDIHPTAGSINLDAGDTAGVISFAIAGNAVGEFNTPAADSGPRSIMFNLDPTLRVGVNSLEMKVILNNSATETFPANSFENQMWIFMAVSTDSLAFGSFIYYGGPALAVSSITTSPAGTGCTFAPSGADLLFTNTSGSTKTFRLTGLRLY